MILFFGRAIAGLTFIMGSQSAFTQTPSLNDFFEADKYRSVELSPEGNRIAYVSMGKNKVCVDLYGQPTAPDKQKCRDESKQTFTTYQLNVYDLVKNEQIHTAPLPTEMFIRWIDWATEDRALVAFSTRTSIGRRGYSIGYSRIMSVSMDDEPPAMLFQNEKRVGKQNRHLSGVVDFLRSDDDHVIMGANRNHDYDLWRVNVVTGDADRIAKGNSSTFHWYTDNVGNAAIRFDCSDRRCRKVKVYKRVLDGDQTSDAVETDESALKWEKFRTFDMKPEDDADDFEFRPIAQAGSVDEVYVIDSSEGTPRRSIKIFNLRTKEFTQTVYEHPDLDIENAIIDRSTGNYIGATFYDDRLTYDLKDKRLQKHIDAINRFFDDEMNVSLLGFNASETAAIVYVSGPREPGTYYLYDFEAKHIDALFSEKPGLTGLLKGESKVLRVPTRDGQSIKAYLHRPEGVTPNSPLIVMPHGGPEMRDYFEYDLDVEYFRSRGYQVLQMNFRGSSGYGRAFAEAGYRNWDSVMHHDLTDSVEYVFAEGLAKPSQTCIYGYSYGGYAALLAGAKTPQHYQCIISGGGISDLVEMTERERREHGRKSSEYAYWSKSVGDPITDGPRMMAASPVTYAANFEDPVLLIHGLDDEIVFPEQSEIMEKALRKAGKPVTYLEMKDVGHFHNYWSNKTKKKYLQDVDNFLATHIGPGASQ